MSGGGPCGPEPEPEPEPEPDGSPRVSQSQKQSQAARVWSPAEVSDVKRSVNAAVRIEFSGSLCAASLNQFELLIANWRIMEREI